MAYAGTVTMSVKELDRLGVLGRVLDRRLTQAQAAEDDATSRLMELRFVPSESGQRRSLEHQSSKLDSRSASSDYSRSLNERRPRVW